MRISIKTPIANTANNLSTVKRCKNALHKSVVQNVPNKSSIRTILLAFAAILVNTPWAMAADGDANKQKPVLLEGHVEHGQKVPDSTNLNGAASQVNPVQQGPEGKARDTNLDGKTAEEMEELSIEWDKWRNRLSKAVWHKFMLKLAGNDSFMLGKTVFKLGLAPGVNLDDGSEASYACEVTRDRQIRNLRIEKSTGNKRMNEIVLRCVWAYNGKGLLEFPEGSQRKRVTVRGKLLISSKSNFLPTTYRDFEKVTVEKNRQ